MIGGGFGGFRLHRCGGIVPILVIRSIIQIGVTVRIAVGIPVNRPDKRLKKDAMVAIRETPVFIAMKETRTGHNIDTGGANSRPEFSRLDLIPSPKLSPAYYKHQIS